MAFDLLPRAPGGTARYTIDTLGSDPFRVGCDLDPVLIVKPAGPANAEFQAFLRKTKTDPRLQVPKKSSPAQDDAFFEYWIEVYAKTVVTGWENIYDTGIPTPVVFSVEKCIELLMQFVKRSPDGSQGLLPELTSLMSFCGTMANFRDLPAVEVAAVGKG